MLIADDLTEDLTNVDRNAPLPRTSPMLIAEDLTNVDRNAPLTWGCWPEDLTNADRNARGPHQC
jgi:hypothetical protein